MILEKFFERYQVYLIPFAIIILLFFFLVVISLFLIFVQYLPGNLSLLTIVTKNRLILISFDGFRHQYLDQHPDLLPYTLYLSNQGINASMKPTFPSITFVNHYSIVTGLNAETHGIISNNVTLFY